MAYPPGKKVRSLSARGPFDSLTFYYDLTFVPEDFSPWDRVHLFLLYFIRISILYPKTFFYPLGSKCEAVLLAVHLNLFYFITISLLTPHGVFLDVLKDKHLVYF